MNKWRLEWSVSKCLHLVAVHENFQYVEGGSHLPEKTKLTYRRDGRNIGSGQINSLPHSYKKDHRVGWLQNSFLWRRKNPSITPCLVFVLWRVFFFLQQSRWLVPKLSLPKSKIKRCLYERKCTGFISKCKPLAMLMSRKGKLDFTRENKNLSSSGTRFFGQMKPILTCTRIMERVWRRNLIVKDLHPDIKNMPYIYNC